MRFQTDQRRKSLGGPVTSSRLLSLDHLFRFAGWAACLLAIGTSFGLYTNWCVTATALAPAISFDTPSQMIGVKGSYTGPYEDYLLLARGRLPRYISSANRAYECGPKIRLLPPNPSN
jgi:hypothetical protein